MTAQDTIHLANDLRDQGKSNEAINLLMPLTHHEKVEISAQAYDAMGLCYQGQRKLDEALDCNEKGLALAINTDLYERIENLHRNIGMIYEIREDFERAEEYFLKSIEYGQKHDEYQDQQKVSIGMTYSKLGKMSVTQGSLDKAKDYFEKSKDAFDGSRHYRWVLLDKLNRLDYLVASNDLAEAEKVAFEVLLEAIEINQMPTTIKAYIAAGDIAKKLGKLGQAKLYYLQAQHEMHYLDSADARRKAQDELATRIRPVLPSDEKDGVWQNEQPVRYEVII